MKSREAGYTAKGRLLYRTKDTLIHSKREILINHQEESYNHSQGRSKAVIREALDIVKGRP